MLRQAIYEVCRDDPGIAHQVGDRIYPERLPDDVVLPAIAFLAYVSEIDELYRTHDLGLVGRTQTRAQLDIYAETGDDAETVTDAVVAAWSGLRDPARGIGMAQVDNRIHTYEPALNRHRVIVDLLIDRRR